MLTCPKCGTQVADEDRLEYHLTTCGGENTAPAPSSPIAEVAEKELPPPADDVRVVRSIVDRSNQKKETPPPPAEKATKAPAKKVAARTPAPADPKKALIQRRTDEWGSRFYEDLNPVIYSVAKGYVGVPDEWCNGVVFRAMDAKGNEVKLWDPPLKNRLQFSEDDCRKIAKACATFSVSPTGMLVAAWVENNAGLIALSTAAFVGAKFGWNLMRTKTEVAQFKEVMAQQQQQQVATRTDTSGFKESPASMEDVA